MPVNGGHGHVTPRADGVRARCGGPALCGECAKELAAQQPQPLETPARIGARTVAAAAALAPLGLTLIVGREEFLITDKPDDVNEHAWHCQTIEQVEEFITERWQPAVDLIAPLKPVTPDVGDKVHYISHGSPVLPDGSQAYPSVCRAAIVTEVPDGTDNPQTLGLCVLNPTGMLFNRTVPHHPGTFTGPEREASPGQPLPLVTCADLTFEGGTWHHRGGS